MSSVEIIAAVGSDGAIGRRGDLAFHISADLRRFKALTMGCPVVMGRKTFESLPKGALPGRRNIVITRNSDFSAAGVETASSLDEALKIVSDHPRVFIIGGGQIYAQAMPIADILHITEVQATSPDADTFFPPIADSDWAVSESSATETDAASGLTYRFVTLRRKP